MEPKSPNGYYPIVLQLQGRHCLIVGGGKVAERKLKGLAEAGADQITVICPEATDYIKEMADLERIQWLPKRFEKTDLQGVSLVIAATDQRAANEEIIAESNRLGILSNNTSSGATGSFITPSVMRSGDLLIAVTTSGASPSLSKLIKQELEAKYGNSYLEATERLRQLRELVIKLVEDDKRKEDILLLAATDTMDSSYESLNVLEWMDSLLDRMNGRRHKG